MDALVVRKTDRREGGGLAFEHGTTVPNLVRSPVGDFIEEHVNGVASSLVLAHKVKSEGDEAAATTRNYYLTGQRMREKTAGMKAWSEALIKSYLDQEGVLPEPLASKAKANL